MSASTQLLRNAGPAWGLLFLSRAQRFTPAWLLRPALMAGTWVAVARMPKQREHSRVFLSFVLERPAKLTEVWRHFFRFVELVMLRLRIAEDGPGVCSLEPENAGDFEALMRSAEPALFGTFHFGHSDLLGFLLGARGRRVSMIRLRMESSADLELLSRKFGRQVSFIWVNEPENLLYALKSALEAGNSLAMQCDRSEFSAKTEVFEFLGAPRLFPFTIYHLALMFGRPVMFCIGIPDGTGGTRVVASPLYRPESPSRDSELGRARVHFQAVLTRLEGLVRQHPMLWFNFHPLNPAVATIGPGTATDAPFRGPSSA